MNPRYAVLLLLFFLVEASCYRVVYLEETDPSTAETGNEVFNESYIHSVELFMSGRDWQAIIEEAAAYENTNPKRPFYQALCIFDGTLLSNPIGLRLKGHISIPLSRGHSFPLKLDFNRFAGDQTLDGLKKLNRNKEYLGIYVLVEQVDGVFLKRNSDIPCGDLYKPEQISGSLVYRGALISDYPDIGHKWPENSDHSSLLHAIGVLHKGHIGDIGQVFDLESILSYLAGNVALGIFDYYPITGHNYYLYEQVPGRFTMLPWDMTSSTGITG